VGRCSRRVVVGRCRNGFGGIGAMIGGLAAEAGIGLGMIGGAPGAGKGVVDEGGGVNVGAEQLGLDWLLVVFAAPG